MNAYVIIKEDRNYNSDVIGVYTDLQLAKNKMLYMYSDFHEDGWQTKFYEETSFTCKKGGKFWHFFIVAAPYNETRNYK